MSKRLQVLLEEPELREIKQIARRQHMTVAEWVRQTLRTARRSQPLADTGKKLAAIRSAAKHSFPVSEIDQMLAEIEKGYLGDGQK